MAKKKAFSLGGALKGALRAKAAGDSEASDIIEGIAITKFQREERQTQDASRKPRSGGKLPEQAALLSEWDAQRAKGKTEREANSVLYARYPEVQPKAIRQKLERARKNKSGT